MATFNFSPERHMLQVEEMDRAHRELAELLGSIDTTSAAATTNSLHAISQLCSSHFDEEERLMQACNSGHIHEHRREHAGILHELERCLQQLARGRSVFAKAWLSQRFPDWLEHHLHSMDSALAAELKNASATDSTA